MKRWPLPEIGACGWCNAVTTPIIEVCSYTLKARHTIPCESHISVSLTSILGAAGLPPKKVDLIRATIEHISLQADVTVQEEIVHL